ncbi:protein of unknown function [Kyrpidia spormannii]|uniref:Uncharacterized protein n=1 Tax=Kyrpidia spormannii TaxID=2055160 RepID=A0ACA8ZFB3_9BACL|nr:protein of unknown function [Kyrpidia spormannii]
MIVCHVTRAAAGLSSLKAVLTQQTIQILKPNILGILNYTLIKFAQLSQH